MAATPFTMYEIENVITDESSAEGDYASSDASPEEPATLREALDALLYGCWDNVDGSSGSIVAYPADYHQDMHTGDYVGFEVIINGDPRNITRLLALYEARSRVRANPCG
jgi:hypothetical protein